MKATGGEWLAPDPGFARFKGRIRSTFRGGYLASFAKSGTKWDIFVATYAVSPRDAWGPQGASAVPNCVKQVTFAAKAVPLVPNLTPCKEKNEHWEVLHNIVLPSVT